MGGDRVTGGHLKGGTGRETAMQTAAWMVIWRLGVVWILGVEEGGGGAALVNITLMKLFAVL